MANKKTYYLREFRKGDFMLWSVCSQCWNNFTITIRDDKKEYDVIRKNSQSTELQKLAQKSAFYEGGSNLRLEVEFHNSSADIKESMVTGGIVDAYSNTVGYSYTYCLEDDKDMDYNDAYITIIAWRKKG